MANSNERIDALEVQIRDMFESDPDALGILKQFSLRRDALEVNLEATDNAQYAENTDWEGMSQELQDGVEHHAQHVKGTMWGIIWRSITASTTEGQTDAQDNEEKDAVGAFPQWCNAVTMQVNGKAIRAMVDTDASDFALEGVLMQECHPVAYESRKLNEAERRYTTYEKELLEAVHCLRVWRHYLLGSSFIVRTDNTTVSHFLSQSKLTSKQSRWQELLAEFKFMIEYMVGSTNSIVDALSRRAELDQVALMAKNAIIRADSQVAINIRKKIRKALTRDPVAQQLLKLIESGKTRQFWHKDGLLMTKGRRVYVPRVDDLRRTLIRECHDTL
ncbi:hypothetical protein RJ639_001632 [Escallonia herrerae]|uniref:Reverse transcriptase RNase H-like domain-containing protein n=1 Tax=Escallonia herrerae TaxID=1293975 RepID=A0AA89BGR9_9ASTE|nr:hypothetical protein RJ639_001632 [Escallonia herrerae]